MALKAKKITMKDVVLSASSRFYPIVVQLRDQLEVAGIKVCTPDMDFITRPIEEITAAQKRELTKAFFRKIEGCRAFCIVTDASGYVGRSVSLEAGYAYALGRPLFSLMPIEDDAIGGLCTRLSSVESLAGEVKLLRRIVEFGSEKRKSSEGALPEASAKRVSGW